MERRTCYKHYQWISFILPLWLTQDHFLLGQAEVLKRESMSDCKPIKPLSMCNKQNQVINAPSLRQAQVQAFDLILVWILTKMHQFIQRPQHQLTSFYKCVMLPQKHFDASSKKPFNCFFKSVLHSKQDRIVSYLWWTQKDVCTNTDRHYVELVWAYHEQHTEYGYSEKISWGRHYENNTLIGRTWSLTTPNIGPKHSA